MVGSSSAANADDEDTENEKIRKQVWFIFFLASYFFQHPVYYPVYIELNKSNNSKKKNFWDKKNKLEDVKKSED